MDLDQRDLVNLRCSLIKDNIVLYYAFKFINREFYNHDFSDDDCIVNILNEIIDYIDKRLDIQSNPNPIVLNKDITLTKKGYWIKRTKKYIFKKPILFRIETKPHGIWFRHKHLSFSIPSYNYVNLFDYKFIQDKLDTYISHHFDLYMDNYDDLINYDNIYDAFLYMLENIENLTYQYLLDQLNR